MHMRHIVICGLPSSKYVSTLLRKRHNFCMKHLFLIRNQQDMIKRSTLCFM